MANMTVTGPDAVGGIGSKLKKVVFTHTLAATATGTVETTYAISGTLLRLAVDDGGDAAWDLTLSASSATIWSETNLGTSALTRPLGICYDGSTPNAATDATMWGIPLCGEKLTATTANMSGGAGVTGPVITIIYREE